MKRMFVYTVICIFLMGCMGCTRNSEGNSGMIEFTAAVSVGAYHGDPNKMVLYEKIAEETGVKANFMVIPDGNIVQRRNIMINSGDMPDVFYREAGTSYEIDRFGRQGIFLDLTDLIPQYSPNLAKIMEEDPVFRAEITNPNDGRIYSVGGMHNREAANMIGNIFVYQPWLDKLGLLLPTTYIEFENMLRAFKKQDPNGNGKADEFPFVFANEWSNNSSLQLLFAMFGYAYQGIRSTRDCFIETEEGKAVFVPATEEYKEAIIWLNKLFSEGLLEAEDYTARDRNLFTAKMFSDEVIAGSFVAFHKIDAYVPANRFNDYVRIEVPIKGPRGHQIYPKGRRTNGVSGSFVITSKGAKKAPDILRWLDAHFDPMRSIEVLLGPVDINIEMKSNGMWGMKDTPPGTNFQQFRFGQTIGTNVPFYIPSDAWGTTLEIMEEDADRLPWIQNVLRPYVTQFFIHLYPIEEESRFIQGKGRDLDDYVRVSQAKWLMEGGIERDWDAFQARLTTMGVDEYTRIMQNQIDRFNQFSR